MPSKKVTAKGKKDGKSTANAGKKKAPAKGAGSQNPDDSWSDGLAEELEGLNLKQTRFVMEYAKSRNGVRSYMAAYGDHVTYSSAGSGAHDLLKNPKIRKAIRIISNSIIREYRCDPQFILQELAKLAHFNPDDIIQIQDDGTIITDLSMADRDMLAAIEHIETEELYDTVEDEQTGEEKRVRVGQKVKVKIVSRRAVLNDLAKIQKMYEANFSPRAETVKIIEELEAGKLTVREAAFRFTKLGLPLPEVIKIELQKGLGEGEGGDEGSLGAAPEELDRRYEEAIAGIKDQEATFLPERQAEVIGLKEELKAAESFNPDGSGAEAVEEF